MSRDHVRHVGHSPRLDFLVRNRTRFAFDKLISNTYPLEKINEAFAASEWHGRDAGTITRAALVP